MATNQQLSNEENTSFRMILNDIKSFMRSFTSVSWLPDDEAQLNALAFMFAKSSQEERYPTTKQIESLNWDDDTYKIVHDAAIAQLVHLRTRKIEQDDELSIMQQKYLAMLIDESLLRCKIKDSSLILICRDRVRKLEQTSSYPNKLPQTFGDFAKTQYINANHELYGTIDIVSFIEIWNAKMREWGQAFNDGLYDFAAVYAYHKLCEIDRKLTKFHSEAADGTYMYHPDEEIMQSFRKIIKKQYKSQTGSKIVGDNPDISKIITDLAGDHPFLKLPNFAKNELWLEGLKVCLEQSFIGESLDWIYYVGTGLVVFLDFDFRDLYDFYLQVYTVDGGHTEEQCRIMAFRGAGEVFCDNPHAPSYYKATVFMNSISIWCYIRTALKDAEPKSIIDMFQNGLVDMREITLEKIAGCCTGW